MKFIESKKAWDRGKTGRAKGFMRVSPYYEDARADYFWYAGYDGRTFEEADQTLREEVDGKVPAAKD